MTIQWYPGHMHKAQKEIRQSLAKVDILIEVLDARIPFSSENPMIAEIRGEKPCLKVLCKSDLADPVVLKLWQEHFEKQRNVLTLLMRKDIASTYQGIPNICKKLLPAKANGVKKMRAMIVGIPNVGKSTLINLLAGRTIAKTGNEPAVTKHQQFIQIEEDFVLLDTPGILWPKQEYEHSSYRLAATGAVKDTAIEYGDVAFFVEDFFRKHYPEAIKARFELDSLPENTLDFFEAIGQKRGCLTGGGRVDLTRISKIYIHELRAGHFGPICLETPAMIEKEVEIAKEAERQKQEKKEKVTKKKTRR
ncbi:MAG: ribosome biogenesis GTPase YlqF [Agarilytica sp.]